MSSKNAMDQLEKLMECCRLPNTADSYQKYIEKIRDLYSQLSERLSLKINAVGEVEHYGPTDESLKLQDDSNWSAENEEKVIAGFQEKSIRLQAVVAEQKKFLESLSKSLKMLSALERLYQIPLKLVNEFQATSFAAELKFQSEMKPLMDEAIEMFELAELAKNFTIKDQQLLGSMETDILAKIKQFKADIEARSSSSWLLSELQAVKEGLRLVETERESVLEKFAALESWRKMQILALDGKREELLTLVERFKENVKEKKVLLPLLIALNCVLVESKSLTADGTSFIRLHNEYMEMKIETIMMKIKTNKTDPRCALAFLDKAL